MEKILRLIVACVFLIVPPSVLAGVANGKLQIHYIDVGQGDGAILISPKGETVMFDSGNSKDCAKPLAYLESIGVTEVDYHVTSHYHSDHIGCATEVFGQVKLKKAAYDRGQSYSSNVYRDYVKIVGNKRTTVQPGTTLTLDAQSANPVRLKFITANANGIQTDDENDKSVVVVVEFGGFKAEFGGDLSGESTTKYKDIETSVAPMVGPIDVYKVHHHCSSHSTNPTWMATTKPTVGIISVGDGNDYGHPTEACLTRLHDAGIKKTYWTERGNGAAPDSKTDVISGSVVVEVVPNAKKYTVSYHDHAVDEYAIAGEAEAPGPNTNNDISDKKLAWSKLSNVYHHADCDVVKLIKPANIVFGDTPPAGKTLHKDCPKKSR